MIGTEPYAPLPGASPVIAPSMTSACPYAVALAFVVAPSALRGRLRVFPMTGAEGTAPVQWKRRATDAPSAISAWARSAPDADLAARTGCSTGLVIVQVGDADALAAAESAWGALPDNAVRSMSRDGRLRCWMRIPSTVKTLPTRLDLAPGVRVLGDGAYVRLPPAGHWTTPPDDDDADYQPIPPGWLAAVLGQDTVPQPSVRFFH